MFPAFMRDNREAEDLGASPPATVEFVCQCAAMLCRVAATCSVL